MSFANQHDDSTADSNAGFHYAYSDTGDFTGITYASASGTLITHDYTGLNAGNYTFYARIIDKDDGFTQYSTTVTVAKADAMVTVNNYSGTYDTLSHTASVTIVRRSRRRDSGQQLGQPDQRRLRLDHRLDLRPAKLPRCQRHRDR